MFWLIFLRMLCHRIRYTEGRLLGFSYDFGITRNSSSNADAMVLASACLRGIHPPDIIQNGKRPGGECLLNAHWLEPWRQHLMMNHGVAAVTRVDLLCALFCGYVPLTHLPPLNFSAQPPTMHNPKIYDGDDNI